MVNVFRSKSPGQRRTMHNTARQTERGLAATINDDGAVDSAGFVATRITLGRITTVTFSGTPPRYTATAVDDPSIVVTDQPTQNAKANPAQVALTAAPQDSPCWLALVPDGSGGEDWVISDAWQEYPSGAACSTQIGGVTGNDLTVAVSQRGRSALHADTLYTLSSGMTKTVAPATTTQYGFKLCDLPTGVVHFASSVIDIVVSSAGLTNQVRFGLGTTLASGTGTTLSAAERNVHNPAAASSALTAAGVTFQSANGTDVLVDNTAGGKILYLNFCPTAVWNAASSVVIADNGRIPLHWWNAFTVDP